MRFFNQFLAFLLLFSLGSINICGMEELAHKGLASKRNNKVSSLLEISAEKMINDILQSKDIEHTYQLFQANDKIPEEMQQYLRAHITQRPLKRTLLHEAQSPHQILQLIAGFGIDPTIRTVEDETPLHTLLRDGKREEAKFLAHFMHENSIPVNQRDMYNESALKIAKRFNDTEMIKLLKGDDGDRREPSHQSLSNNEIMAPLFKDLLKCESFEQAKAFLESLPKTTCDALIAYAQKPEPYTGLTQLHKLTHAHHIDTMLYLGAKFDLRSKEKQQPLHYYIKTGKFDLALAFLQKCDPNFDINGCDVRNMSPLAYAICAGHEELISLLLAKGAKILCPLGIKGKKLNPLLLFLEPRYYRENLVSVVFCQSVLSKLHAPRRMPLLQKAVRYGYDEVIKKLLDDKTFETLADTKGMNFIMYLAMSNHNVTLKKLLKTSPNLERTNNRGDTALFYALTKHSKTLKTLLEQGATINHQNNNGFTPLHIAIAKEQKFEKEDNANKGHKKEHKLVDTLLASHPLIEISTVQVGTPLLQAVACSALAQAKLLLKAGANPCAVDAQGKTVLHHTVLSCPHFLYYLGNTIKPILNARDHVGNTALHYAVDKGNLSLVKNLLALGADIDCQDAQGSTPLMHALTNNHEDIVLTLLEQSANQMLKDLNGKDCYDYLPNDDNQAAYFSDLLAHHRK